MRIISKFVDYYDSVQGVMYDSDMIYIRNEKNVKIKNNEINKVLRLFSYSDIIEPFIIGFCNNFHLGFIVNTKKIDNKLFKKFFGDVTRVRLPHKSYEEKIYHISYDLKEIDQLLNNFTKYKTNRFFRFEYNSLDEAYHGLLNQFKKLDIFEKYKTPIFIAKIHEFNGFSLTSHARLKYYHFQKILDPYSAYQELVIWVGNQSVNEYPPQIEDDIVLRDSKGFDKWSFKKMPTKR